jgi:hypothetical protein
MSKKKLSPFDLLNAFTKVVYGKSAYQVVKDVVRGKAPKELPPEEITEEMIFDAVEDVLGPGFFEDEPQQRVDTASASTGPRYDGYFYYFDEGASANTVGPRRGPPKSHRVASEYADWFRVQAERARGERGGPRGPAEAPPLEMSRLEACRVLGVPPTASVDVIRQAFRVLAKRWHPDVCAEGKKRGEEMFTKIAIAYKVLVTQA